MRFESDKPFDESEEEFMRRIRTETREKILMNSTPIDLAALRKSMELPDSSHSGIFVTAHLQSNALKRELIASGKLIPAENLGFSAEEISQRLTAGELFYLELDGKRFYPAFFTDTEIPSEHLAAVCRMLNPLGGAEKLQFFIRPKNSLNVKTPLEALKAGRLADVERAANLFVSM